MNTFVRCTFCFFAFTASVAHAAVTTTGYIDPTWYTEHWSNLAITTDATLTVDDGSSFVSYRSMIGCNKGLVGEATVTGTNSVWRNTDYVYVGFKGTGVLNITDQGTMSNGNSAIGCYSNSRGTVTVAGSGSTWTSQGVLYVGSEGNGVVNILSDGVVNVSEDTWLGLESGGKGTINFDSGTLNTGSLHAGTSELLGTGTVYTTGFVSDVDLLFDATHNAQKTIEINNLSGQNVVVHLNQASTKDMGVGFRDSATLTITDGVTAENYSGYLGYHKGSTGNAIVSGNGSTWENDYRVYVGNMGTGNLTITDSGTVNSAVGYLGKCVGSTGTANIIGSGAAWNVSGGFSVGYEGSGKLIISDGGTADNNGGSIGQERYANGEVIVSGSGSTWTLRGDLGVAKWGTGRLVISDGAVVTSRGLKLADYAYSKGDIAISGVGSAWNAETYVAIGVDGDGSMTITDGGLMSLRGSLTIDAGLHHDSFVNMSSGGMLALWGQREDSLSNFLSTVSGTRAIRWWDDAIDDWAPLDTATMGEDYTLEYLVDGDLAGYTVLTVGVVPEPGTLGMVFSGLTMLGLLSVMRKRNCMRQC